MKRSVSDWAFETIQFSVCDHVATINLHRPKQLNAINRRMLEELSETLRIVANANDQGAQDVSAVLITGNDRVFAAGADIQELAQLTKAEECLDFLELGHAVFRQLEQLDLPTIAVIRGAALGGGLELSLACDLRVASVSARLGTPEINLGLLPGWGGTSRLAKLLPLPKWKEMILTGEPITGLEALQFGLVNRLVSDEAVLEEGEKLAQSLAMKPRMAVKMAKRLSHVQADLDLQTSIEAEKETFSALFGMADRAEGIQAFLEKRAPVWRHR
jgi:enoyl-CoA hydratase/carnithine racemase